MASDSLEAKLPSNTYETQKPLCSSSCHCQHSAAGMREKTSKCYSGEKFRAVQDPGTASADVLRPAGGPKRDPHGEPQEAEAWICSMTSVILSAAKDSHSLAFLLLRKCSFHMQQADSTCCC